MTAEGRAIRVLIVDDHPIVRSGLQAVLQDEAGLEIVGEASHAAEAIKKVKSLAPDVVLMDIRLEGDDDASGIEACRRVRSEFPKTQVIMFTSYGQRESVLAAIMAGATGFLTKNVRHARLVEAIRAAGRGESLLDPSAARAVVERLASISEPSAAPADVLSAREREVLLFITRGYTNKEIAAELTISPYTARNHVIRILGKLGLSRRSEVGARAVRMGLISDD